MSEGRVDVDGDVMTARDDGRRFQLQTALHFLEELTGAGDPSQLVGKVKDLDQLQALGGEHCADSVVLDDFAYQVIEGFVAEPVNGMPGSAGSPKTGSMPTDLFEQFMHTT